MSNPKRAHGKPDEDHPAITIMSTATAVPPHRIGREEVKTYMRQVFSIESTRLDAMMSVIDNSQVKQRYCVQPVDYIIRARPLTQISQEYQEHSIGLGRAVATDCLKRAGIAPADIDMIITVSCTGFMIPSLDAYLINDLGFRPNVRRLPITELGCAAGAAALTKASEFICAFPGSTVLVIAVEIPSLTFQRGDISQANLISTVLFGDGAAAAAVTGRSARGPKIVGTDSYLFPHSLDAMGFDLRDTGFHIVLSKDVPQLIRARIKELLSCFLARYKLTREQLAAFILHPGGQKLLLYIEEELGLSRYDTQLSWDVLREYGNLSSASVLFVLDQCLAKRTISNGEYGLLAAFGPGFSAEMLLLRWA